MVAFNDVVVARLPGFGSARLRVEVGGEPLLALSGDGVVIASPTGSTAYTVGAGGPAVAPTSTPSSSRRSPARAAPCARWCWTAATPSASRSPRPALR